MPKRGAAETATGASASAKKAKKAPAAKEKKDVRGDDIIKLDDAADDAVPVETARKAAKKQAAKMNVHGAFGREKDDRPRVLYIGHVPHGFYEDQMRAYFGQFGDVTRLRLSRNKKALVDPSATALRRVQAPQGAPSKPSPWTTTSSSSPSSSRPPQPGGVPSLLEGRQQKVQDGAGRAADAHDRERPRSPEAERRGAACGGEAAATGHRGGGDRL